MKTKKRFAAILLAAVMAASTACSQGGGTTSNGFDTKTYNTYVASDPESIDAQKGSEIYGNAVVNNVYEPLIRLVQDENKNLKVEKAGAEDYTVSEDATKYTFKIRQGMVWEDDTPVTAHDYEYGIKRTADPNTGSGSAFLLADVKNFDDVNSGKKPLDELGVKALDDYTLEITLAHPAQYFEKIVPFRVCFPQRQDIVEQNGDSFGSEADTIMACGPYTVESWTHNSQIVLKKNPKYWDADKVQLETVNMKVLADLNARMNAFQADEVMSINTNLPEWTEKFDQKENVEKVEQMMPSMDYLAVNHEDKLFSNKKVRQAFNTAIDREDFNAKAASGTSTPAYYWVPGAISIGDLNYREKAEEPIKDLQNSVKDPKALLSEGLKELGMDEDPSKLEVSLICVNEPLVKKYGEYLQENLQKVLGVKINLEVMEWAVLSGRIANGDYQLGYLAWTADYNDPSAMLSLFRSSATSIQTGWKSEEYDKLLDQATKEKDSEKAADLYKQAETMLAEESVIIPLLTGKTYLYYQNVVKNINENVFSTAGFKYTYIEENK
ncbi:MAG: peptide ABC transporter substrate-binding protein [Finegoldia sp.]|nr:peptide ABC transporter substrate-binding protein [Finegoldia sp.]